MAEVVGFGSGGDGGVAEGVVLIMSNNCCAIVEVFGDVAVAIVYGEIVISYCVGYSRNH